LSDVVVFVVGVGGLLQDALPSGEIITRKVVGSVRCV